MLLADYFKRFSKQIKNLSVYFLAALIPMVLSFISNPFIAKNMESEDYAIVGYYTAFNSLFGPLVNFYLLHYYTKRFYELTEERRKELKATLFYSLIFFSVVMFLVSLAVLYGYKTIFNKESQIPFLPYAVMALLPLPIGGIYSLTLTDFRMRRDSGSFFKISVSHGVLGVVLSLLFVVAFKWGAVGRLGATLLTSLVLFFVAFYINRDLIKIKFDKTYFKEALLFCWPLVLASMLTFFSNGYDKVFLERRGDIALLGIYSVGVSIATYLHVFSTSINDTFQPDIFENIVKRNYKKCAQYIAIKLAIMSACVVAFIIMAPFLVHILTFGKYDAATPYAIIVSISTITSMMYYSMSQVTVALGYTSITLTNKIIGSVLSILSYGFLISRFGAKGAACGMVLSYVYFFLGNVIMVLIKYKRNHSNENRNTDLSSAN